MTKQSITITLILIASDSFLTETNYSEGMLTLILVLLTVFWFLGFIQIPGLYIPNVPLFIINNQTVTLWNLLIFILIVSLLGILPSPLKEMAGGVVILWLLSILGIIAIAGLANLLVLGIILGLILFILGII